MIALLLILGAWWLFWLAADFALRLGVVHWGEGRRTRFLRHLVLFVGEPAHALRRAWCHLAGMLREIFPRHMVSPRRDTWPR